MMPLALKLVTLGALAASSVECPSAPQMEPENTYAFITGVLEWENKNKFQGYPKERRMDQALYEQLRAMGVPEKNMVLLLDKQATNERMLKALEDVVSRAGRNATLIFYYAGHGYPVGDHFFFASYDAGAGKDAPDGFNLADITSIIKKSYQGKRVLLTADCCYSGALGHVAKDLHDAGFLAGSVTPTSDAALNTEKWTFSYSVIDALRGRRLIDKDGDGYISVFELHCHTRNAMYFVDGQWGDWSLHGMKDSFRLAKVVPDKPEGDPIPSPYHAGQFVKFTSKKKDPPGRIVAFQDGKLKIEVQRYLGREIIWKSPGDVTPCKVPDFSKKPKVERKVPPEPLSAELAAKKATVNGKYTNLLRKIRVRSDFATYGEFSDYGMWRSSRYAGFRDLPEGYWVYVYPHWYIFDERTGQEFKAPEAWEYSAPLIAPEKRDREPSRAQKDPSVVFHDGKWHLFMTVKLPKRSAIEYCSFGKWEDANASKRTILKVSDSDYFCACQVFYFTPHRKWYLVYQMGVPGAKKMWVAYSTTRDLSDPDSWTKAKPMLDGGKDDPRVVGGLDYWIICDDARAYLFLTSLNGKMWRLWTTLDEFPNGFRNCQLALQAKIFEASHTYRLKGSNQYLTIIEENGRRYYKAYVADRLDGAWKPVADTADRPFAGWKNVRPARGVEPWTDNVSHGELIRSGIDQTLTVDPNDLRFVFQGMLDRDKRGKGYGAFSWRIGILTPAKSRSK